MGPQKGLIKVKEICHDTQLRDIYSGNLITELSSTQTQCSNYRLHMLASQGSYSARS